MYRGSSPGAIKAHQFAKSVIDQLGWQRETYGNWWHAYFYNVVPYILPQKWYYDRLAAASRAKFLKEKAERDAKKAAEEQPKFTEESVVSQENESVFSKIHVTPSQLTKDNVVEKIAENNSKLEKPLEDAKNKALVMVGPSGAGKGTLLESITSQYPNKL